MKETQTNNENMERGDSTNRMDRGNNLSYIQGVIGGTDQTSGGCSLC